MTEEYPITTHPDGKQFIRIEDKWMPLSVIVDYYNAPVKTWYSGYEDYSYMTALEMMLVPD